MIVDETEEGFLDRRDITDRLPGYRLLRQLSKTEMSEVFLAVDTTVNRQVALKVVGPELIGQPAFRDRFERESDIAVTLEHPNVVPAYAAGASADGELCYLAMRYIRGSNLRQVLDERGGLGLDETIAVARQVAAALDAAHDRGLIHRDVKPANILVEEGTNQVYLCDFGIARNVALTTISVAGAFIGTPYYSAPEQADGGDVDRRADVYSLGCVIHHCLTGHPSYAGRDTLDLLTAQRSTGSPVDRVLLKALAKDPADRHATCGELVEDLAAAAETARSRRVRRRSAAVVLTALGSVVLLILGIVVFHDPALEQVALARVPAALRDDCRATEASMPGAASTLSCRDVAGRAAVSALFASRAGADDAYTSTVGESGVSRNQGDCETATGAEHRYPATGPARGRVLCYARDGLAVIVWTDDDARTVSRAEAPVADDVALRRSWSAWTGAEAFPTADERMLLDVAAGSDCVRVSAVDLDAVPAAVAGVTCVPRGSGARQVSYYRFASLPDLQAGFTSRVDRAGAPRENSCAGGTAPGFLGTHRHDWLGVDLGQVLCQSGPNGTLSMDWSVESLSMIGRVIGDEPAALTGWWSQWHLAPLGRIIDAVNARAPPFPSEPERALLAHIPAVSRVNCVRPSAAQVWRDVGATSAVGVACGRTSGAGLVVYYQFQDVATMRSVYGPADDSGADCTGLPSDFTGEHAYSRGGGTGRLQCGVVERTGERYLEWTDERLAIRVVAHQGTEPIAMIDWWTHDAGPI